MQRSAYVLAVSVAALSVLAADVAATPRAGFTS
jgi:hypothetical protein